MSPYIKDVADTTRAQMEQAQEQAQSGALGTAVSSGAFGGDRAGVAAANLSNQQNLAMGSTMANIYNQGYTQALGASQADLARQLQGGSQIASLGAQSQQLGLQGAQAQLAAGTQMADLGTRAQQLGLQGGQAQLAAGTQMQQTEQAGLDALINQFQQEQGYPFQVAQFLANIAMGTGALSGSTTTSTQQGSVFSDRRLKHDIKKIGEADNGLPIYTFKYKGDENQQTHVGFMADEVEKKNPDAVGLDPSGYKTVDYDKAAQSMGGSVHAHHKGEAFAEGGVAGPYGSKVGQGVGVGSYVPQAFLPVGELMMADPDVSTAHQQNALDTLNSMASAGKSVVEIRDLLKKEARGGVVGNYADGGGVQPQVHNDYLSSTLAAQEAGKDKPELKTAQPSQQQGSGLANVASVLGSIASIASLSDRRAKHDIKRIGKTEKGLPIYTFKYKGDDREQTHVGFMADEVERNHPDAVGKRNGYKTVDYSQAHKFATGGVAAGRHGYAVDGAVEERDAMRLTRDEVPAAQTLGSLPNARVVAAEVAPRTADESANAYRTAAENRFAGLAPTADQVRPMPRPAGLVPAAAAAPTGLAPAAAPTVEQRPLPRPAGLGPAAVTKPMPRPEGLGKNQLDLDRLASTFRLQESGSRDGNYSALGQPVRRGDGVDYAYGAYGIMGANIPSWTEEVLGTAMTPEEFLRDPAAQDRVAKAKLAEYHSKYGNIDDVASVWFSGRPLQNNNSVDATSGKSVPSYVSDISNAYYGGDISGGAGVDGLAGGDRLGTQEGGVKPYDERNALGKMVYDKDGKVNKNAMLSLFAGLGDMLSSPSPFLLPAIGAGISGAANTYMAREEQVADIENKKLDAMKKVSDETIKYNNRYKTNYTTAEYEALALDINTPPPDNSRVSELATYAGVPLDPFGGSLNELIDSGNGTFIRAADSLQYNERLLAAQQNLLASGSIDAQTVANTAAQIEEIKARNGVVPVLNADGSQKVDANGSPVYTTDSTVARIEQARVAQVEGDKLKAEVGDRIAASQTASTAVDKMVDTIVAAGDQQGILAPIREIVSGVAQELGLGTGNFRALQNEMEKSRASFISANGELTDMARDITGSSLPSLSNEAAANAYVAATMQAYYEREAKVLAAIEAARSPQEAYTANIDEYAKFDMKAATDKYYKENLGRLSVAEPASADAISTEAGVAPESFTSGGFTQEQWNALTPDERALFQ
jgi:protein-disulfide isomerase-like protein with CxxC motif